MEYLIEKQVYILYFTLELKELVAIHGIQDQGNKGILTKDEVTMITGVLDMSEKKAFDIMTKIENTFMLDINTELDREQLTKIYNIGHSRIPIYNKSKQNIVGVLLAKVN